ncbi:MAG: amidase domain-containing protein [Clostridia bacterium]|nr:amidase domain-containing protein [Clostridia bacterium]
MLVVKPYARENAVRYARKFAFSQNPYFKSFAGIGGNCTNFVSQSIFAGSCQMNYTPTFGWYYISLDERSPSWTGVEFFYNFITGNKGIGPFGREASLDELEIGDVIQLGRDGVGYYHTLIVVGFDGNDTLIAAQTDDALDRPLSSYNNDYARYIKIEGVRYEIADDYSCFDKLYNAVPIERDPTPSPPAEPLQNE